MIRFKGLNCCVLRRCFYCYDEIKSVHKTPPPQQRLSCEMFNCSFIKTTQWPSWTWSSSKVSEWKKESATGPSIERNVLICWPLAPSQSSLSFPEKSHRERKYPSSCSCEEESAWLCISLVAATTSTARMCLTFDGSRDLQCQVAPFDTSSVSLQVVSGYE